MIDVERVEAWLGWILPTDQRSYFQHFPPEPPLFLTTTELLEVNRHLREAYDGDDSLLWAESYLAVGTNGCGDYHYIVRGFDRVVFYADPDRLGEWGPTSSQPLYHSIAAMMRHTRKLREMGLSLTQVTMERLVKEANEDVL